jgi:hypothetical protein
MEKLGGLRGFLQFSLYGAHLPISIKTVLEKAPKTPETPNLGRLTFQPAVQTNQHNKQ